MPPAVLRQQIRSAHGRKTLPRNRKRKRRLLFGNRKSPHRKCRNRKRLERSSRRTNDLHIRNSHRKHVSESDRQRHTGNAHLPIKVVDYYEDLNLIHGSSSLRPNGDENLLPGVDDIFLVSNAARDAYFFKQGQRTAFSSGLELITKGTYALKQEDENKATLTLTFSLDASPATEHHFTVWGNTYLLHRLDKNLHLNWGTPPIGETRTSPAPPPAYTLEEITEGAEPGTGRQVGFILNYKEIPTGILP